MALVAYSPIARGDGQATTSCWRGSAPRTRRPRRKSACAIWCSRTSSVIPRTSKLERLAENAALFDFALSEDEMAEIAALASPDGRLVDWSFSGRMKWD